MHKSFYEATKTPDGLKRVAELIKADYEGRLRYGKHQVPESSAIFNDKIDAYSVAPAFRPFNANELIERIGSTIRNKRTDLRHRIKAVTIREGSMVVHAVCAEARFARYILNGNLLTDFVAEDGSPLGVQNA